ncbi:NAD-dependent epimerase/dehydratase family protein [Lacrimispora sp.]|uniref:NAD-dependent epimerase/dehydratase family protein n=1 Tax=Lacrimispora sp. TaxID=2719234 RepID=UPI0028B12381|nr:NAD(P)-dependent oxidoreductase [Lacrimispora sp.]
MNTYLITGATGYIGKMIAERLLVLNHDVTVIVRNSDKLCDFIKNNAKIIEADLVNLESVHQITGSYEYLIHCAASTQSSYMMSNPVEVAESVVNGTQNILELAARCHTQSMVYLSSMEVYGQIDCSDGRRVTEEELGNLDISDIRSCYPMAKRMAENFCHLYQHEYGVPVKIARLAQTFGRGVKADDNRVFAQFARAVKENKDIVLHTHGNSVGNYCDIDDAVDAILFLLENGKFAQAYNIVNEANTMTIREMAEMVADKIAGNKIGVTYNIPKVNQHGYAAETGLRLSGSKMKKLGWEAKTNLEEMYRRMIGNII